MCEFSLEHVTSRPARKGELLVTFQHGSQASFIDPLTAKAPDPVAVCLQKGTQLVFDKIIETFDVYADNRQVSSDTDHLGLLVQFDQINLDRKDVPHDILRFPSGEYMLVSELFPKQTARVLQLPSSKIVVYREPTVISDSEPALSETL